MGQPIRWQYDLVWTPEQGASRVELYRISSAGHRFRWASASMPESTDSLGIADVLQQLYTGVLELMQDAGIATG
jgi:hypothetical protein